MRKRTIVLGEGLRELKKVGFDRSLLFFFDFFGPELGCSGFILGITRNLGFYNPNLSSITFSQILDKDF